MQFQVALSWDWRVPAEKLITAGQQMGNTTFKSSQRQPTITHVENPVE